MPTTFNKDELTEKILQTLPSLVLYENGLNDRTVARAAFDAILPEIEQIVADRDFWYERWRTTANHAISLMNDNEDLRAQLETLRNESGPPSVT